jgi:DNA-binding SARP family transcriptional activator
MKFRILGPMEVEGSAGPGVPYAPRAAKLRVVLGSLLVHSPELVSAAALTDELWQDGPPRTATTTLQVYVSQLRKHLNAAEDGFGRRALLTRRPGYLLHLDPEQLDLACFESLRAGGRRALEAGDFAQASALLRRALELWRGPLLSDTPRGPALEAAAVRLDEAAVAALEQRIRADLGLGRHRELIPELQAVTRRHPLREEFHGHLMLALFRTGRQAEALSAFTRLRRELVAELAIEPCRQLRRLHMRILAGDERLLSGEAAGTAPAPAAARPASRPALLPAADPALTGREPELAHVVDLLTSAPAGTCVAVAGMPGAGASALAVAAAHRCADAFPDGRVFLDLEPEPGRPLTDAQALARLLRRAGATGPLPGSTDDLRDALHTLLAGRRLLLVLDHAHDEARLRLLLAAAGGCGVLATMRRTPASLTAVRSVSLSPLPPEAARALLVTASGLVTQRPAGLPQEGGPVRGAVADLAEIAALCGGLPLALRGAAAQLAARPHWTARILLARLRAAPGRLDALGAGGVDVRGALLRAYDAEPADQRAAFRLLALLPDAPFRPGQAAAALGLAADAAGRRAESLVDARLLEAEARGRYRFHPLMRLLAGELLARHEPLDSRRAAAGRVAEAYAAELAAAGPAAAFSEPGLAAHVGMLRSAHANGAWLPALRLADALSCGLVSRAAWQLWRTAHTLGLDAARRVQDSAGEARMLCSLGELAWQQRRLTRCEELYDKAVRAARATGGTAEDELGRALVGLADLRLEAGAHDAAGALLDRALALLPERSPARPDALRAAALLALARREDALAAALLTDCRDLAGAVRNRPLETYARRCLRRLADPHGRPEPPLEVRPGVWRLSQSV